MRFRPYRFPCEHPVIVARHGERVPAQIINISAEGARMAGLAGLAPGDVLRIEIGPGCPMMVAEVRWSRATLAGLRFREDLAPRQLAMVRHSVVTSATPRTGAWNLQLRELR